MSSHPSITKPQPINGQSSGLIVKKSSNKKIILLIIGLVITILIGVITAGYIWYNNQLRPVGGEQMKLVTIEYGKTPGQIGELLESESIIRSSFAFDIYTRFSGKQNLMQAGTYRLSPADSMQSIVEHLINGSVDQFSITFYPGATLADINLDADVKKFDVTTALKNAGYTESEIAAAFNADYDLPLFDNKPVSSDLEGYVYGDTYNLNTGASAEDALEMAFNEFYDVVVENDLVAKFKSHGLNLYQGITLASIVQREATNPDDQKQVAQVFYKRLASDIVLGSDVTYQYIADKTGVQRDVNLDSPYNTRKYGGLPPGPIAVPGLSALLAVANPANGDYLYFLSDPDGKMYFAKTQAEHESNIVNFCKEACLAP